MVVFTYGRELRVDSGSRNGARLRRKLRAADGIVGCSEYARRLVQDVAQRPLQTCCVYPGIAGDGALSSATNTSRAVECVPHKSVEPVLVSICRHVKRKGLDMALLAFREVLRSVPEARYVIAGTGPDTPRLRRLATRLNLESSVCFRGEVSDVEKHRLLDWASCFVMPNRDLPDGDVEGFGIVFLEAGLHRVPSIAGSSGGAPEAVVDGETGFVVDPNSRRAIASAMMQLLCDRDLRERMGNKGRDRAMTQFTWGNQARVLGQFLMDVVRKGHGQRVDSGCER